MQRRAQLVEVGLRLRLDGHEQGRRSGSANGGSDDRTILRRRACRRSRSPGAWRRRRSRRRRARRRLLLLAVEAEELAEPLLAPLRRVPDVRVGVDRAREDPEVGQLADERVGGRLEDEREQRAVRHRASTSPRRRSGSTAVAGPRRPGRGGRRRSRRGSPRIPTSWSREPTQHGRQDRSRRTPLRRQASSSSSAISSPSRYFVRTSSSASAAASTSWSRRGRPRPPCRPGSSDLDLLAALDAVGLAVDQVDVAARSRRPRRSPAGAARSSCRTRLAARRGRGSGSAFSRSHLLIRKQRRGVRGPGDGHGLLEAGLDAAGGVHHEDRRRRPLRSPSIDLGREVEVAGGVDQGDPGAVRLERRDREAQRLAPLLLLGLEVEVDGPVVHLAERGRSAPASKRSCSPSVVLPAPACPARTTLRRWGRSTLFIVMDGRSSVRSGRSGVSTP